MKINDAIPSILRHRQQRRFIGFKRKLFRFTHLLEQSIKVCRDQSLTPLARQRQGQKRFVSRRCVRQCEIGGQNGGNLPPYDLATIYYLAFQQTQHRVMLAAFKRCSDGR